MVPNQWDVEFIALPGSCKTGVLLCAWVCICMGVCVHGCVAVCGCVCLCMVVCLCVAVCGCVCLCVAVWVVVGSVCLCVVAWACGHARLACIIRFKVGLRDEDPTAAVVANITCECADNVVLPAGMSNKLHRLTPGCV